MVKELKSGTSDFVTGDPILASADSDAIARIRENSINKPVYIIRVQGLYGNEREFHSSKNLVETPNYVQFTGIEILVETKKTQKTDRNSQVLKKTSKDSNSLPEANKGNVVDIKIPWHRIIEIQNVSYQNKNAK